MYLQDEQLGGIKKTLKKAAKVISAPLRDTVQLVTHPVKTVKEDVERVKLAFKGDNPMDPFAALASVTSMGLRPIDKQLQAAGVKGGTATPADIANKELGKVARRAGVKGYIGAKPATAVAAVITTAGFASGAGIGAGAAGGSGGSAAGSGSLTAGGGILEAVKKGKKIADNLSPGDVPIPEISNSPEAIEPSGFDRNTGIALAIGVLGFAYFASRGKRAYS